MARRKTPRTRGTGEAALVAEAEAQVMRMGQRLGALIARLEDGDFAVSGEVAPVIAALDKALGAVLNERQKRGFGDELAGGELDLEAARREVRRRMDRLRATAGLGELPEGA